MFLFKYKKYLSFIEIVRFHFVAHYREILSTAALEKFWARLF